MAEIKLVFKDEISPSGEDGISITIEDADGSLETAKEIGELTQAQLAALDIVHSLEFVANEVYVDGELVESLSEPPKETH